MFSSSSSSSFFLFCTSCPFSLALINITLILFLPPFVWSRQSSRHMPADVNEPVSSLSFLIYISHRRMNACGITSTRRRKKKFQLNTDEGDREENLSTDGPETRRHLLPVFRCICVWFNNDCRRPLCRSACAEPINIRARSSATMHNCPRPATRRTSRRHCVSARDALSPADALPLLDDL